jgi:uncharacterized alpha-E superfamily protein
MESMTRGQAWRFLDMGRRLERAMNLVLTLRSTLAFSASVPPPLLEALLEAADSVMTYRRRYLATLQVAPVVDLLLTDETNPRSVVFQLALLGEHLQQLPRDATRGHAATAEGIVLGALSRLRSTDVEAVTEPDGAGARPELGTLLGDLARELPAVSDALTGQYLNHAIASRQLTDGGRGGARAGAARVAPDAPPDAPEGA